MRLFTSSRPDRVLPTRASRKLRPVVDGFEARRLMSGATISGTAFRDITGNGSSHDDTPLAGVTIQLYQSGSSKVFESTTTASNGTYSFKGLSAGTSSVQQVVPSNDIATEALQGYSVSLKSGATASSQNFDDFTLLPKPMLSNVSFVVTTPGGKSTTVSTLHGNVQQGDTVKAKFDLAKAEQITLVAYEAPNSDFNTTNLQEQVIFDQAATDTAGAETLTVTVPDGYFQIDFVAGPAIDHLETNPNITYHAQDRFVDGDHGGSQPDLPGATKSSTVATSDVVVPVTSSVTQANVALSTVADVVSPMSVQARKH